MNTTSYCREPLPGRGGFAAHMSSAQDGMWQGQSVTRTEGAKELPESQTQTSPRVYMDWKRRGEKIAEGFVASLGTYGLFQLGSTLAISYMEIWPVSAEGLNLLGITVPPVVYGYSILSVLNFSCALGLGACCVFFAGAFHITMKYLHTGVFGEKEECARHLKNAIDCCSSMQNKWMDCEETKSSIMQHVKTYAPWYERVKPEDMTAELDREYERYQESVEQHNKAASLQERFILWKESQLKAPRKIPACQSSPEYMDHRLGKLSGESIAYRVLMRKKNAQSFSRNRDLKMLYREKNEKIRQDNFGYAVREEVINNYCSILNTQKEVETEMDRRQAIADSIRADYKRM